MATAGRTPAPGCAAWARSRGWPNAGPPPAIPGAPVCSGAVDLSAVELRVLGSLVEKQLTTPQQYPLTLNALVLACNQTSNRDPVVAYDEATVESAVRSAKGKGLAGFLHPAHGRSALRYRHTLDEALGLETRAVALLAVLVLRGPQTLGELRTRTERMVRFEDLGEVEAELEALAARAEPLVRRLDRRPGQKEERYGQLLGPAGEATVPAPPRPEPGTAGPGATSGIEALELLVETLRAEVAELRGDLDDLRRQLGA